MERDLQSSGSKTKSLEPSLGLWIDRHSHTLATICCLPQCTLAGSWVGSRIAWISWTEASILVMVCGCPKQYLHCVPFACPQSISAVYFSFVYKNKSRHYQFLISPFLRVMIAYKIHSGIPCFFSFNRSQLSSHINICREHSPFSQLHCIPLYGCTFYLTRWLLNM